MKRHLTAPIAAAAIFGIAVLTAGCGNSADGAYSSASYGSYGGRSLQSVAAGAATVGVRNTTLGSVLVDGRGRTLYLFEKDRNRRSACYGQCAIEWLPLLGHGKPVARHGAKQSLLGTSRRANGSTQVTYAGHPLYRFVADRNPGDTTGEGLEDFGAGWDAVSPAGKKIEADG